MTNEFAQPFQDTRGLSGFNYLTAGTQPSEKGVAPAQRNTLNIYNLRDAQGKVRQDIGGFEITIHDFSVQGYNHPEGLFSQNSNGFAWARLMTHRPNELVPPPSANNVAAAVSSPHVGLHSLFIFDTLMIGTGDAANAALFKETSSSDPTLVAITYTPGATQSICSLSQVLDDGATRLAVGRVGAATQLLSDATGTVATTMHTSTNSTWGIILSGLNSTTPGTPVMLIYAGTTIGTKATDADLTTAITTTLTGVNAGGFAIGAVKAGGREQRAYWAIPRSSSTAGALTFGSEAFMDIWSTNMEATDILPVELKYLPFGILNAVPFRDGILATDSRRVIYWDGNNEFDLGIFRRRVQFDVTTNTIQPDRVNRVRGLLVNGPECGALCEWYDANNIEAGRAWLELYNFESGSWHSGSEPFVTNTATVVQVINICGPMPMSLYSRLAYFHYIGSGSASRIGNVFVPQPGASLLWQHSLGSGNVTTGIPIYAGSLGLSGCKWWLDGIMRNSKVITEVEFDGNLDHGGTGIWTFNVQIFGTQKDGTRETAYNKTFSQGGTALDYTRKNSGPVNIFDVQLYLEASASSSSRKIPQLLPLTIRGVYSKNPRHLVNEQQLASLTQ